MNDYKYQGRLFVLFRKRDVSGVSGTGVIAEGIEFPGGKTVIHWVVKDKPKSLGMYDSVEEMLDVHGHEGATEIRWVDNGKKD